MVLSLPDAQSAEEHVRLALSGWKSAYCYTLTAASAAASPPFRFHVEWSRRPSPHEPLPTVRVHMTAAVDAEGGELSCRLEGEQTVHRAQLDGHSSLDSHILRLLKAKAEFVKRARLPLSAADSAFLSSRLHYASYTPPPLHTTSARDASHSRLIAALDREARGSQPPNAAAVAVAGSTQRGSSRGSSSSTARYTVRRRGWEEEEEEYGAESGSTTHLDGSQSAFEESAPSAGLDTPSAQQAPPASQLDGSAGGGWVGSLSSQSLAGNRAVSEQVTASTFDHASSHAGAAASGGGSGSGLSELLAYSVPSAAALEDRLVELFRQADVDGSGRLSVDEVSALLSSAAVGLSLGSTSLHSFVVELMSAYDENGDGQLVWAEWLPVAVDLIQTAAAAEWAKQASEKQQASYQRRVSERLAGKQQTQLTAEIASLAAELDPTGSGLLPPAQFQQLMHAISVQLHESECEAVLAHMEKNGGGDVEWLPFRDHTLSLLSEVVQTCAWQADCTPLETNLLELCRAKDSANTGVLATASLRSVLQAASAYQLQLSATQLSALLFADRPADGAYDYVRFVRRCALMLSRLFDASSLEERDTLAARGVVAPIALLTAADRERVEAELRSRFVEFDSNSDGSLDADEFAACMADTSLCLDAQQIEQLRREADEHNTGQLHIEQFMKFAYNKLLHLAREARIQQQHVNIEL